MIGQVKLERQSILLWRNSQLKQARQLQMNGRWTVSYLSSKIRERSSEYSSCYQKHWDNTRDVNIEYDKYSE